MNSNSKATYAEATLTDVDQAIHEATLEGLAAGLGCSRRDLFNTGGKLIGAMAFAHLTTACKTSGTKTAELRSTPTTGFFADIAAAESITPLVAPTDPNFPAAAKARGTAIGGVIGKWLKDDASGLTDQLFSKTESELPIFKPQIGPVIIFRHKHVIAALENNSALTVGRYSQQMKRGTDGAFDDNKPGYYILGTDNPGEYNGDARLLRHVLGRSDMKRLRGTIRESVKRRIGQSRKQTPGEIDMVQTIARYVPVDVVGEYLGIPSFETHKVSFDGKLKGGDEFDIDPALQSTFKFTMIAKGKIPTQYDMYTWVRDAFRNIFNNVSSNPTFERDGIKATENLTAYIHKVLAFYKDKIANGQTAGMPDTMLTRLLKLQRDVNTGALDPAALGFDSLEDLKARLEDSRIRSNVFGTVVGAIANPEEGNARIISKALNFRNGQVEAVAGQEDYNFFADLAAKNEVDDVKVKGASDLHMAELNTLALELLRLAPQGEVVLRECVAPVKFDGLTIVPGVNSLVFVGHGMAMSDESVVTEPKKLSTKRNPQGKSYSIPGDPRKAEAPQSTIYLQHGYGRHKCLGRYASELTMEEVLRGVLLLKNPVIKSELRMDLANLYAESLVVTYDLK